MMKLFRIAFAGIALTAAFLGSSPSFVHGKTLEPVWQSNFKSMQPGCCRAENRQFQFSKPFGEFKKRSWNSSAPEPRPIDSFIKDHKKELYLLALPQKETLLETNRGLYEGMSVLLVNGSLRESPSLETCRKFVGIVQEAKDQNGQWKAIEHLAYSSKRNDYNSVSLGPKEYLPFSAPQYVGSFPTTLRFTLYFSMHAPTGRNQGKRIHSNEFRGSVNPSQFKMHEPSEPIYRGPIFKSMITKVARVSVPNGIIFLSVGTEHGISKGEVFFLEKEGKPTARIKISEAKPKYCVANILPRFGNPRSLQAGDQVKVVR